MKWYKVFESKEKALQTIDKDKAILLKIGTRKIALANYKQEIFGTADMCPHNGEALHKGQVNYLGEIICPWHNYRFDLKSGRECQSRTQDLATYPIENRKDGVYIGVPE